MKNYSAACLQCYLSTVDDRDSLLAAAATCPTFTPSTVMYKPVSGPPFRLADNLVLTLTLTLV